MSSKRLFRQDHPVLMGFIILGMVFLFIWGGITFFISAVTRPAKTELFGKEGVGVIELKGVIVSPEDTLDELTTFRTNANIKAIILRVDSPGGAVGASQELYDEVRRTNKIKPVVASLGSVAASGGYYVALGSERIIASAGTLTGSMGVILKFANLEGLFGKIGYKSEVIKSGDLKDIGSPDRPMTQEERDVLQTLIDNVHDQFVRAVTESRKLPEDEVRKIADGRIFSGEQAKELGLIDQLGNFTDAALLAAELAGLKKEMPRLVYPEEKGFSLFKLLAGENTQTVLGRAITPAPVLSYEWTVAP